MQEKNNIELEKFILEYERRANTKNFDQIRSFIDTNAIFWFSDGSFHGLNEIQLAFEKTWNELKDEIYSISDVKWLVQKDSDAVCIYKFSSESTFNNKRTTFHGRGTNVLQKLDNKWKIIHEHLSLEPKKQ